MARRRPIDKTPREPVGASASTPYDFFTNRPWLLALILAVVTFVAYQPAWHAGFIWDDDDHLTENPAMTAPEGLRMIWSSLSVSRYYPLTLTSFWVQRRLWGLDPEPYHMVNIALHAINGILLFLVLRRLRIPAAWLAAMLWAVHPVNVESVAWITELKNTQSGVFFFLALLCFFRFEDGGSRRWYALAFLCGLAAMLSKPSTVVLPLVLLLCVWWQRKQWRWMDVARIVPFFGLALGMSALTIREQSVYIVRAESTEWKLGVVTRLLIASKAVWFYAAKLIWPVNLVFVYPRWEMPVESLSSWLPLAGLIAVGVALWVRRGQRWARAVLFGIGVFVGALLPVLGFFDVFYFRYSYVADHFQYLASAGLIALAAGAAASVCERAEQRGIYFAGVAAPVVLLTLSALTWQQAHIYRDLDILWRDTLAKNPDCWMADHNLGVLLFKEGRFEEAGRYSEEALRLRPDDPDIYTALAGVRMHEDKAAEAMRLLEQALRIKPAHAQAHYDLGLALARSGRMPEAMWHWEQAIRANPDYADAHCDLGVALVLAGEFQKAIEHLSQAVRIKPDYAEAEYNWGLALARLGRVQEAQGHWEQALRIDPNYAEARDALARLGVRQ